MKKRMRLKMRRRMKKKKRSDEEGDGINEDGDSMSKLIPLKYESFILKSICVFIDNYMYNLKYIFCLRKHPQLYKFLTAYVETGPIQIELLIYQHYSTYVNFT